MALRAVLTQEQHEELDEGTRGLYKASGDKFVLDVQGVDEHPTIAGLKSTLEKYKAIGTDAEKLAKRVADADKLREQLGEHDLEELLAMPARIEELEKAGDKQGDIEAAVKRATEMADKKHGKVIEQLSTQMKGLADQLSERDQFIYGMVIESELDEQLARIKVIDDYRPAVKALLLRRKHKVVRNEEGTQLFQGIWETELGEQTAQQFVEAWATSDEAEHFLPASGNNGSGAQSDAGKGGRGRQNPWAPAHKNVTDQAKMYKENPSLARQYAAQYGVILP